MMRKTLLCAAVLLCAALLSASADDSSAAAVSDQINRDLAQLTDVATVTKANEPYQPYIITTLEGKKLEALGVMNLKEALELLPGVDIATDLLDLKTPIFRGSNPFAYGQVKLLIDDMVANDLLYDGFAGYLYMPIQIIKRIEVIRGPGSNTDGINAYAGSIHVITYAEEFDVTGSVDRAFALAGSYGTAGAGFVTSVADGAFHLHADGYYYRDDKMLPAGPDAAATGIYNFGPPYNIDNSGLAQTGDAPLQTTTFSLGLRLDYEDFYLKARATGWQHGSAYGINAMLPQEDDHINIPSYLGEIGWQPQSGALKADIRLGTKYDSFKSHAMLLPPGFEAPTLSDPQQTTVYIDGFTGIHEADQRSFYQSSYLTYGGLDDHKITLGYRLTREETYHVVTITTDRDTGVGLVDYSDTLPFLDPNAERDTVMASIQDQMEVNPSLSVLYGINVEKTSMTDTQYDPRISVVYQEDAQNIFKAIYSHSHRNPSWQELFVINTAARVGNPNLKPEQVDTFELAAIRKFSGSNYLQAVAFYAINKDLIDKDPQTRVYENAYDNELYGIELELYTNLTPHDSFYLGYSYITGRSSDSNALANVAHHLVKSYYQYDFSPSVNAAAIVRYVGAKTRLDGDTRSNTDPYLTTDLTLRYVYLPQRFSVTGSIKNVTDARIVYPSEPYTYVNDYPQEGRTFFLTLMKEF